MTQTCACSALVARVEQAPFGQRHRGHARESDADAEHSSLRLRAGREDLVGLHFDARQHHLHVRHRFGDGLAVAQRNAERFLAQLRPLLGLDGLGAHDDVPQAEAPDRLECLLFAARADRQHGDHRADAEDHPEHRQRRPQLVPGQALQRRGECLHVRHAVTLRPQVVSG